MKATSLYTQIATPHIESTSELPMSLYWTQPGWHCSKSTEWKNKKWLPFLKEARRPKFLKTSFAPTIDMVLWKPLYRVISFYYLWGWVTVDVMKAQRRWLWELAKAWRAEWILSLTTAISVLINERTVSELRLNGLFEVKGKIQVMTAMYLTHSEEENVLWTL